MTNSKNVLIFYAKYGEGHKRAAKAIEANLKRQMPEVNVKLVDFLGETYPISDWIMRKLYLQTFSWAMPIYQQFYYRTKDFSVSSPAFTLASSFGALKLERYLKETEPSIVISTFPTLTGMLSKVKERARLNFQLYCVLTDYVVHSQWLYHDVDRYFVPTELIRKDLILRGIEDSKIKISGIPVMPEFEMLYDKKTLQEKWGLNSQQPVVLLSAGAFGVLNIEKDSETLVAKCPDTQFIVVCGRNKKLYKQLSNIPGIIPVPFTNKMHELMQLSDLFVTKAGGLSVSEAIASEVPMVLFKSLSGQETENVKYLIREKVAKRVKSSEQLVETVAELLKNEPIYEKMKLNIKKLKQKISFSHVITEMVSKEIQQEIKIEKIKLKHEKLYEIH